jgi:REP element-mobilizing transposase RayT
MGHTFTNHLFHIVFSTKERQRFLQAQAKDRIMEYTGGIVRSKGGVLLDINGTDDHVHMLVKLAANTHLPKFVGDVKANSSRWISQAFQELRSFAWQPGYSSFTVSESLWRSVAGYIQKQEDHHRKRSFEEELRQLLRKHNIDFDPTDYLA